MKNDFKFCVGENVKDVITGFEGAVMTASHYLFSGDRYSIQPTELLDNKVQEAVYFDEGQLVSLGSSVPCIVESQDFKHELGSLVKHALTKVEGQLVSQVKFFTGCNRYAVQPIVVGKDKVTQPYQYFDEDEITVIKKGKERAKKVVGGYKDPIPARR